jgi:nucleotide-binding universal stress UspA family protein
MIRCIVVPVDGTEASEQIIPHLSELIRAADAEIRFVHVYDWSESGFRRGRDYLKDLESRVADRFPTVHTELLKGMVPFEILRYSLIHHADLIAMTPHSWGIRKLIYGSTSLELLHHSQIPLFLVRPSWPVRPIRKILVPIDGSKTSQGILPVVQDLARGAGAHVNLLTVLSRVGPSDPALRRLQRIGGGFESTGVPVLTLVRAGDPVREILEASRDLGSDVIALGTHGRTGSERFFMGSVAEMVIHGASVPLLVRRKPRTIPRRRVAVASSMSAV